MHKQVVPTSYVGIKRLAKTIKAERNIPLHEAQDVAAQRAGFQSFRHAENVFSGKTEPPAAKLLHTLYLTAYWKDRSTGAMGRETLTMSLSCSWADLVTPAQLKRHPTLYDYRAEGPDHLAREHMIDSQSSARRSICAAARGMIFMDATKLRPSKGHSRAFPGGRSMNGIPGRDHPSVWYDPESKGYVYVDEPYIEKAQEYAAKREAWARETGFDLVQPQWPGMYAPDLKSRMFLNSNRVNGAPLARIVAALNNLPPPLVEKDWDGESVPFDSIFISPGTLARASEVKIKGGAKPAATRKPTGPRNSVGYVMTFVGPQRRPNRRMPLEAHTQVGQLLKSVVAVTNERPGAHKRLNSVRGELDEWVQREYRSDELPNEQFFDLYYHETGHSYARSMPEVERNKHCASLDSARKLLVEHYPDCAPLRRLLKQLDLAQKSLRAWGAQA